MNLDVKQVKNDNQNTIANYVSEIRSVKETMKEVQIDEILKKTDERISYIKDISKDVRKEFSS